MKFNCGYALLYNMTATLLKNIIKEKLSALEIPLTTDEYCLLTGIYENENELESQVEMCRVILKDRARVTRLIAKMEKAGFLEKSANPNDKRKHIAGLTVKGRDYIKNVKKIIDNELAYIAGGIEQKDLDTAFKVIQTMRKNLENKNL